MTFFNSYEAKTHLSELIRRALSGERIVIARAGKPLVELTPFEEAQPRKGGIWEGKIHMSKDFDDALPEVEREIYGGDASS